VNCFRELRSTSAASSSHHNQIIVKQIVVGTVANKEVHLTRSRIVRVLTFMYDSAGLDRA